MGSLTPLLDTQDMEHLLNLVHTPTPSANWQAYQHAGSRLTTPLTCLFSFDLPGMPENKCFVRNLVVKIESMNATRVHAWGCCCEIGDTTSIGMPAFSLSSGKGGMLFAHCKA